MQIQSFNKATAAAVAGAIVTLIASFIVMDPEVQGAAQTILTTLLVYFVANKSAQ